MKGEKKMKEKKSITKLVLRKNTIANLESKEMTKAKAGAAGTYDWNGCHTQTIWDNSCYLMTCDGFCMAFPTA